MHFPSTFALSLLPHALGAAVPAPQNVTSMVAETFTTASGEERTVYFNAGAFNDDQSANPKRQKRQIFTENDEGQGKCEGSRFDDKTTGGSPLVSDCECLRDYFKDKTGTWNVGKGSERVQIGTCRSCNFGVQTDNFFGTNVGNQDAYDVIRDSIEKFKSEGKIGTEGYMGCHSVALLSGTDWAIY